MATRREKKKPRAPTKKEIDRALSIVGKGNFRSTARARSTPTRRAGTGPWSGSTARP